MKKTKNQENDITNELSLKEAMLQVVFLINNKRYDSALEIVRGNEISLPSLNQNKSINYLDDFEIYVKNKL